MTAAPAGQAWQLLVVAALFLLPAGPVRGQATDPALSRLVQLAPGTRPLGVVLAELSRQGHLPLSYSSSLVPVTHPAHLAAGPARPLGVVLEELLAAEHLSFGLLNGQLVLWPAQFAVPAGAGAVNGRPARAAHPIRLPAASTASPVPVVPATGGASGTDENRAAESRLIDLSVPLARPKGVFPAPPTKPTNGAITRPKTPIAKGASLTQRPSLSIAAPATQRLARSPKPPDVQAVRASPFAAKAAYTTSISPSKRAIAKARTESAVAIRPSVAQHSARALMARQAGSTAATPALAKPAFPGSPARTPVGVSSRRRAAAQPSTGLGQTGGLPVAIRTQVAGLRQQPSGSMREPVALLTARVVLPRPASASDPFPPLLLTSAGPKLAPTRNHSASLDNSTPTTAKTPFALVRLLRPSYLHAEVWGSETLPLNAAVKVGIPRIYLTLGIAATPPNRQPGGLAGSVGLGTVGQPWGRFTPSLDLLHWFLSGDREGPGTQLTQLRPLLAWQLKPGGRLQLIAGPTLNLATGPRHDPRRPRGDGELGEHQWLWLNSGDDRSFRRLWPGVQLGLRF